MRVFFAERYSISISGRKTCTLLVVDHKIVANHRFALALKVHDGLSLRCVHWAPPLPHYRSHGHAAAKGVLDPMLSAASDGLMGFYQ